jgi:hypothetical protein
LAVIVIYRDSLCYKAQVLGNINHISLLQK